VHRREGSRAKIAAVEVANPFRISPNSALVEGIRLNKAISVDDLEG
jgi:hypothetical protein